MSGAPGLGAALARAILAVLARHLLTAAGTALVMRGVLDPQAVDALAPALAEEVAGALLIAGGLGWAALRARRTPRP